MSFNLLPYNLFIVIVNIMDLTIGFLVKITSAAYVKGELSFDVLSNVWDVENSRCHCLA